MKIYHYKKETGEYWGESNATEDPNEKDHYLLPAQATFIKPPTIMANQIAVFQNNKWIKMSDYRKKYYNKITQEETILTEIGQEPDDTMTDKKPMDQFDEWYLNDWAFSLDKVKKYKTSEMKYNALLLLNKTDWKVIRHRDQVDASQQTSLSSQEYQTLLTERDNIRKKSDTYETQINSLDKKDDILAVEWEDKCEQ